LTSPDRGSGPPKLQDDDEEAEFDEKWTALFSDGSPLVKGTVEDPFAEDLRRRKVVWKKKRAGHHRRYQQRRQQREGGDGDDGNRSESSEEGDWGEGLAEWKPSRDRELPHENESSTAAGGDKES